MATQTLTYCTTTKLGCCPETEVIICVPTVLVVSGLGFLDATMTGFEQTGVSCGNTYYTYTFEYDDTQLVTPETPLVSSEVSGVICSNCLLNYIENSASNGNIEGNVYFSQVQAPLVATAALAGLGAGNVDNGTHLYKVTFVTDTGETELGYHISSVSVTVVDKTSNGQVQLSNIQVGQYGDGVVARKIYRTFAAGTDFYFLATINDNTTTTYLDNTADASLSTSTLATFRPNTTFKIFLNTSLDRQRIMAYPGVQNTSWGVDALQDITTGYWNVSFGEGSLADCTTGHENTALGLDSMNHLTEGHTNVGVGIDSLYNNILGHGNTACGTYSLIALVNGIQNTALGKQAGASQTAGDRNLMLGYNAQVASLIGSDQLSIGNQIYGDLALGKFGVGVASPVAVWELKAGSTTIGPLRLNSGTNLTTPVNGTFEYDGTNLYFTTGGVRKTVTLV